MSRAATATKAKKKPADFKRPKRKVGRRVAPAANVTKVGITSRRINLLEQSILQDKAGVTQLTHRHQALSELLQQVGHYNAHVRQRALQGIKELTTQKIASNLRANASVILEHLLPTLQDEEVIVREVAVQTWKALLVVLRSVIAPFATLVTTYFCSGLTHLQVGVRQDTLKSIGELLDVAPELLREDVGQDVLARLLENFRDLICAAQTQGIKMKNTYDVLQTTVATCKKGESKRDSRKTKQNTKSSKAPSGALALRFAALKVLHKLLLSLSESPSQKKTVTAPSARVPMTKTLLLFPSPHFVTTNLYAGASITSSSGDKANATWQDKVRLLLPVLLELWLECIEGGTDNLSDIHLEHMQYIVECTAVVVAANTNQLHDDADNMKQDEFTQTVLKLREELLAPETFPIVPSASATLATSDSAYVLSKWHGMNLALATFACGYLRLSGSTPCTDKNKLSSEELKQRVCTYVVSTLAKYQETAELRAIASMQNVLKPLLKVVTLMLASALQHSHDYKNLASERRLLLDAVTQFYVRCTPKSVSFRSCTLFVVEQLEIALHGQRHQIFKLAWPMVMQWVVCLADSLSHLNPQHIELSQRSLLALIAVFKQLPVDMKNGDEMEKVLANLSQFFDLAAVPSSSMSEDEKQRMLAKSRFDALSERDQVTFVALLYHLPRYPVSLLRAFASCCKSPRIYDEAKRFLIDILFQRRHEIDLAHMVSFLVSTALAPVVSITTRQREQLQLVDHVCRTFVAMNLGNSLATILAPTLAKAQAREGKNITDLHTLILLYRTCVSSALSTRNNEIQRSDIPVEMEQDLRNLCLEILICYTALRLPEQSTTPEEIETREQEQLLVSTCISTLVLSESNIFASFVEELLVAQEQASVLIRRLRVLLALMRTPSLAGACRRHRIQMEKVIHEVTQQHAGEENIVQLVRQLRGDLKLLAIGQSVSKKSSASNTAV
ncbi:putative pre-rRNA-processing protein Ipi1 [Plasmopara halstedii]